MNWAVLLPVLVSAAVIILLYTIPPPWVKRYLGSVEDIKHILTPVAMGDAVHHALVKNEGEVLTIVGEEANGIVHEAIPAFSAALANEAMGALAAMYSKGVASEMGKKSGAARGYLALPGIGKQAVKQGAEGLLGGALGQYLPEGVDLGQLLPLLLQGGLQGNGAAPNAPQPSANSQSLPQLGNPV